MDLANRVGKLTAAVFLIAAPAVVGMDRVHLNLLGSDEGSIDAEFCYVTTPEHDANVPGTNWQPGRLLRTFIDDLKSGRDASALLVPTGKSVQDSLPVPKAFYTEQQGIRFERILIWYDYVGLGVEYLQPNGNRVRWREDFRCGPTGDCLLDFGFAGTNELLETLYYRVVARAPGSKARVIGEFEVGGEIEVSPPFPKATSEMCPLRLTFALSRLTGTFCRECDDPPDSEDDGRELNKVGTDLSKYLLQSFEQLNEGGGWAELLSEPDAESKVVANVGITGSMAGISLPGYLRYLSDWQQVRFLGFLRDGGSYFVLVEFQRANDVNPILELLRLQRGTEGFEQDFSGEPTLEQNLLYRSDVLGSMQAQFETQE